MPPDPPLHLWGPDVKGLDLDSEMEEIELGERVSEWVTNWMGAAMYSSAADRAQSNVHVLVGAVASATS